MIPARAKTPCLVCVKCSNIRHNDQVHDAACNFEASSMQDHVIYKAAVQVSEAEGSILMHVIKPAGTVAFYSLLSIITTHSVCSDKQVKEIT